MCGRLLVRTPGRVIAYQSVATTLKVVHILPCQALGIKRIQYAAVRILLLNRGVLREPWTGHHVMNCIFHRKNKNIANFRFD